MRAFKVIEKNGEKQITIPATVAADNSESFVFDSECVKQALEERLSIIQGEFYLNTTLGVPVIRNKITTDLAVQDLILTTEGVDRIVSFTSKLGTDRNYVASIVVKTIFSDNISIEI